MEHRTIPQRLTDHDYALAELRERIEQLEAQQALNAKPEKPTPKGGA